MIEILAKGENKTRKEATWAVAKLTSGGAPDQIRYLVELNVIPSLCDLLTVVDGEQVELVEAALNCLYYILKSGQQNGDNNPYAFEIRGCGGLTKIENLTRQQKENISQNSVYLVKTFFVQDKDTNSIPQVFFFNFKYRLY